MAADYDVRNGRFSAFNANARGLDGFVAFEQDDPYYLDDEGMGVNYGVRYRKGGYGTRVNPSPARDQFAESRGERAAQMTPKVDIGAMNNATAASMIASPSTKGQVARYLASGYNADLMDIARGVQAGDADRVNRAIGRVTSFRDANRKELTTWIAQRQWGGEALQELGKNAFALMTDEFLTKPIDVGYNGAGKPVKQVTAQSFLATGLNTVGDVVANFLEKDANEHFTAMERAAKLGDIQGVKSEVEALRTFAKENKDGLFRWEQYGAEAGTHGEQLQSLARAIRRESYLDQPMDYGMDPNNPGQPEGKYTARDLISDVPMPEQVKQRAAGVTANTYEVGERTARILVDVNEPMHGTFNTMLRDAVAGEAAQKASTSGDGEGAAKVVRARSAIQLYGRHFEDNEEDWRGNIQGARDFYSHVYASFGGGLSRQQLDELARDYMSASRDPNYSSERYFQGWKDAASTLAPTETMQVNDGQRTKTVEVESKFADPKRLLDTAFDVKTRMSAAGLGTDMRMVNDALRSAARQQDAVEKTLNVSLADLGYGDALAAHTVYTLSGDRADLAAGAGAGKSDAHVIRDAGMVLNQASQILGIGGQGESSDTGAVLPGVAEGLRRVTGRVYLEQRKTAEDKSFSGMLNDEKFRSTLANAAAESVRGDFGCSNELAAKVGELYVESLRTGRNKSVKDLLMQLSKRQRDEVQSDGTVKTVRTEPQKFVGLRDGKETDVVPTPVADGNNAGLASMTSSQGAQASPSDKKRAREALSEWADGTATVYAGMPLDMRSSAQHLAEGIRKCQDDRRHGHSVKTDKYAIDACDLLFESLKLGGKDVPSWSRLISFLEGHDKSMGASSGSVETDAEACLFADDLARKLDDPGASVETKDACISLLSEVLPVLSNRRGYQYIVNGCDVGGKHHDFSAIKSLLRRTGVDREFVKVRSFVSTQGVAGIPVSMQTMSYTDIDDDEINPTKTRVQDALREEFGVDGRFDALGFAGYTRSKPGEIEYCNDYGGILTRFEELYRARPATKLSSVLSSPFMEANQLEESVTGTNATLAEEPLDPETLKLSKQVSAELLASTDAYIEENLRGQQSSPVSTPAPSGVSAPASAGAPAPVPSVAASMGAPRTSRQLADEAEALLGRVLSGDEQLDSLNAELRDSIAPHCDNPEELKSMMSRLSPLLKAKYKSGGLAAARGFVDDQGSRVLAYVREKVQGEGGVEVENIVPRLMDGHTAAKYMRTRYGHVDWQAFFRENKENRRQLDQSQATERDIDSYRQKQEIHADVTDNK